MRCIDTILSRYNHPPVPWSVRAQMQGRSGSAAAEVFSAWAKLAIPPEKLTVELTELLRIHLPTCKILPGAEDLLRDLHSTSANPNRGEYTDRVHIALASGSDNDSYMLKTAHLSKLFSVFDDNRLVFGNDPRLPKGRGKPAPDIFLLALKTINDSLESWEPQIAAEECLVFEDSVLGVEAGRRAGMRVIWCPHAELKKLYSGRENDVLARGVQQAGDEELCELSQSNSSIVEYLPSLADFSYKRYKIKIPTIDKML